MQHNLTGSKWLAFDEERIAEQVRRIEEANKPGYLRSDDYMETIIKDGVVTYKRRRGEKRKEK